MERFETLDRRSRALCLELESLVPRPSLIRSLFRKSARPRRGIPWGIAWHFKFMSLVDEARWLQEEMDSTLLELKENRRKANEMQQAHQSLSEFVSIFSTWESHPAGRVSAHTHTTAHPRAARRLGISMFW